MRDVLIIGGGPAGAASAIRLAEAGRDVLLVERQDGPHDKVCGEFLSAEAERRLRRLGLDPAALGAAAIERVAVHHRRAAVGTAIPFRAFSLSRRVMDEALLGRAADAGAELRRGVRIQTVERAADGWAAHTSDGGAITARQVFLATGKHDLRGRHRPPGRQNDLIGFKQHWRLTTAQTSRLSGVVELHLFEGGYAGLEPVEEGRANLCLVVTKRAFAKLGGWEALLDRLRSTCSELGSRLEGAISCAPRPLAIGRIPYGLVERRSDGLWRLGDQAAVIPSFAGEGVSMALESALMAADGLLAGGSADDFQQGFARRVGARVAFATAVSRTIVTGWGQAAAMASMRLVPQIIGLTAVGTRIGGPSLDSALATCPLRA